MEIKLARHTMLTKVPIIQSNLITTLCTMIHIYVLVLFFHSTLKDALMHGCMHGCMYACTHVRMYVCMYVCMHVCMYVRTYVCMYVSKCNCAVLYRSVM